MAKLTEKQQRFVEKYLIDLNAIQTAIRAGYSVKTADQQGSRRLTIIKVQERDSKNNEKTENSLCYNISLKSHTGISQCLKSVDKKEETPQGCTSIPIKHGQE